MFEDENLRENYLEYSLESWLDQRGVADAWELAPALAEIGYDTEG